MEADRKDSRRTGKRIVLAAMSLLISLGIFEIGLAWLAPVEYGRLPEGISDEAWRNVFHRRSEVPGLVYELVPDRRGRAMGTRIETNAYGMRDVETPPPGAAGRDRVVVVGDSFTFGFGVEAESAYPSVLERRLRAERSRPLDVLNLGVGGYGSRDVAAAFVHKAMMWKPALGIVGYVLNDPETEPIHPLHAFFAERRCWQYSNITRLLVSAHRSWQIGWLGDGDYIRYLHAPGQASWESVLQAFSDIGQAAAAEGLPVLVVIFPMPSGTAWSRYSYADQHEQVAEAARGAGLHTLDLREGFSVYTPGQLFSAYDNHPNELAHDVAAEMIHEWMLENPEPQSPGISIR